MAEVILHPRYQPFTGELTPYLRNSLSEDQWDLVLEMWEDKRIPPGTTQGWVEALASLIF